MAVEDGLALLLHLELPALLGVLHLVEHVGAAARARQHVVGVGKGLVVLQRQKPHGYSSQVTAMSPLCRYVPQDVGSGGFCGVFFEVNEMFQQAGQ